MPIFSAMRRRTRVRPTIDGEEMMPSVHNGSSPQPGVHPEPQFLSHTALQISPPQISQQQAPIPATFLNPSIGASIPVSNSSHPYMIEAEIRHHLGPPPAYTDGIPAASDVTLEHAHPIPLVAPHPSAASITHARSSNTASYATSPLRTGQNEPLHSNRPTMSRAHTNPPVHPHTSHHSLSRMRSLTFLPFSREINLLAMLHDPDEGHLIRAWVESKQDFIFVTSRRQYSGTYRNLNYHPHPLKNTKFEHFYKNRNRCRKVIFQIGTESDNHTQLRCLEELDLTGVDEVTLLADSSANCSSDEENLRLLDNTLQVLRNSVIRRVEMRLFYKLSNRFTTVDFDSAIGRPFLHALFKGTSRPSLTFRLFITRAPVVPHDAASGQAGHEPHHILTSEMVEIWRHIDRRAYIKMVLFHSSDPMLACPQMLERQKCLHWDTLSNWRA